MIVAAIDGSDSVKRIPNYLEKINEVLSRMETPIIIYHWPENPSVSFEIEKAFPQNLKSLSHFKTPYTLYIFTAGEINTKNVRRWKSILTVEFQKILEMRCFFIGDVTTMNFEFAQALKCTPRSLTAYVNDKKLETTDEWLLWKALSNDSSGSIIFLIMSHFFTSALLNSEKEEPLEHFFYVVLFEGPITTPARRCEYFDFLSRMDLQTVLKVYKKFAEIRNKSPRVKEADVTEYKKIHCVRKTFSVEKLKKAVATEDEKIDRARINFPLEEPEGADAAEDEEIDCLMTSFSNEKPKDDLLSHVKINIGTCHPYVLCPKTGKHWKECIGQYDRLQQSYIKMFWRYCKKYNRYPENEEKLMIFTNRYLFRQRRGTPSIFPLNARRAMRKVVYDIFRDVQHTYTCEDYLKLANENSKEDKRLEFECTIPVIAADEEIVF